MATFIILADLFNVSDSDANMIYYYPTKLFKVSFIDLSYFFLRFGPYFVEPIVVGMDPKTDQPYLCSFDLIGCVSEPKDFVVSGTCDEQMFGMCETLWRKDLGPEELFEVISQSLVNACDRDAISGWGAKVYIL